MKLIDADNLIKELTMPLESQYKHVRQIVRSQPTVEAIPIEWISDWISRQGVPAESHGIENYQQVIDCMLEDWRKEND